MANIANPITTSGVYDYYIPVADWYRVIIGTQSNRKFGGGTVSLAQDGLALDDLSAVTTQTGKAVLLGQGNLVVTLTGATLPSLMIKVERIRRN